MGCIANNFVVLLFGFRETLRTHFPFSEVILSLFMLQQKMVYASLVKDVGDAFEGSPLLKIDCKGCMQVTTRR